MTYYYKYYNCSCMKLSLHFYFNNIQASTYTLLLMIYPVKRYVILKNYLLQCYDFVTNLLMGSIT